MKSRRFTLFVIYCLAFLTGINFVVFPALGTVLTDDSIFKLSSAQFGNLFIPQVVCIIISSILAPFLVNKWGPKLILIIGSFLMLVATGGLWSLQFVIDQTQILFPWLLVLAAFAGFGFGMNVTTLNPLAASFFKDKQSSAILILQFLVGLGTSTSPLTLTLLGDNSKWMDVPAIIFVTVFIVLILFMSLKIENQKIFSLPSKTTIPTRLWWFVILIIMYGLVEGTFGSFGTLLLKNKGVENHSATLGLSLFWGGIAINRLLFGLFSNKLNLTKLYLAFPLAVVVLLFFLSKSSESNILLAFMFGIGFFMGSLFPGSIAWAIVEFPQISVLVSGVLMAANQVGTGIVTNVLGGFIKETDYVLLSLSIVTIVIFVLLIFLQKNSKIKDAF